MFILFLFSGRDYVRFLLIILLKLGGNFFFQRFHIISYNSLMFIRMIRFFSGFQGGSDGKASAHNKGDLVSIPGSGRSPGEGNGNPLQYSCLENSMDRGAWQATVHWVTKSWTRLSNFSFFLSFFTDFLVHLHCDFWLFIVFEELIHFLHVVKFINIKFFTEFPYYPLDACRVCRDIPCFISDVTCGFLILIFVSFVIGLLILLIFLKNQLLISLFFFYCFPIFQFL